MFHAVASHVAFCTASLPTSAVLGLPMVMCEPALRDHHMDGITPTAHVVVLFPDTSPRQPALREAGMTTRMTVRDAVVVPAGDARHPGRILGLARRHRFNLATTVSPCGPGKLVTCAGRQLAFWDVSRAGAFRTSKAVSWLDVMPAVMDFVFTSMQFISLPFVKAFPWAEAAEPARVTVPLFLVEFNVTITLFLVKLWLTIGLVGVAWLGAWHYVREKNRLPRIVASSRPPDSFLGLVSWVVVCTCCQSHARVCWDLALPSHVLPRHCDCGHVPTHLQDADVCSRLHEPGRWTVLLGSGHHLRLQQR